MAKSEERWRKAARSFDKESLAEIYDSLSPELYRYAFRLVGDVEAAEDLLSETFLRFLRALQSGGGYPACHNASLNSTGAFLIPGAVTIYGHRVSPFWLTGEPRA